jgi:hypothetical protein
MSPAPPSFHAAVRRHTLGYRGLQDALHEAAIDALADRDDDEGDELADAEQREDDDAYLQDWSGR